MIFEILITTYIICENLAQWSINLHYLFSKKETKDEATQMGKFDDLL